MKQLHFVLFLAGIVYSPLALASSTNYQYEATVRAINFPDSVTVPAEEIFAYLDSIGVFVGQTLSGTVGLTPLGMDTIPDNGLYQHFGAIDAGEFTMGGNTFSINTGSNGYLQAFNNLNAFGVPAPLDQIGITSSFTTDLPLTSTRVIFAFTDYSATAISGSDIPQYPIILDDFSAFMIDTTAIINTSMGVNFTIPGNVRIFVQAEFSNFTPVPLPGALTLFLGAFASLLGLRVSTT